MTTTELDQTKPPSTTSEPPKRPRVTRNQFVRIKSPIHDYDQYSRVLGAFHVANMPPGPVIKNAIEKGHQMETIEVDAPIAAVGEAGRGKLFKDENKTIYIYNEGEIEIIPQLINPASTSVNAVVSNSSLEDSTQPTTLNFINTVGVYPDQKPQLPEAQSQPGNNIVQFPQQGPTNQSQMQYIKRRLTDDDLKKTG